MDNGVELVSRHVNVLHVSIQYEIILFRLHNVQESYQCALKTKENMNRKQ